VGRSSGGVGMTTNAILTRTKAHTLRDAISGDLTGLEGRAQRLADRLATNTQLLSAAYADSALTRTNHLARLKRLRGQLDAAVEALDASAAHREVSR
jgi:hypothetical protein